MAKNMYKLINLLVSQQFRKYRFFLCYCKGLITYKNGSGLNQPTLSSLRTDWPEHKTIRMRNYRLQIPKQSVRKISLHRNTANLLGGGVESVKLYDNRLLPRGRRLITNAPHWEACDHAILLSQLVFPFFSKKEKKKKKF